MIIQWILTNRCKYLILDNKKWLISGRWRHYRTDFQLIRFQKERLSKKLSLILAVISIHRAVQKVIFIKCLFDQSYLFNHLISQLTFALLVCITSYTIEFLKKKIWWFQIRPIKTRITKLSPSFIFFEYQRFIFLIHAFLFVRYFGISILIYFWKDYTNSISTGSFFEPIIDSSATLCHVGSGSAIKRGVVQLMYLENYLSYCFLQSLRTYSY